jgi:hypothetical protein
MVGLLTFVFSERRSGRMSWARIHRSNGESNSIGMQSPLWAGMVELDWWRLAAKGRERRSRSINSAHR